MKSIALNEKNDKRKNSRRKDMLIRTIVAVIGIFCCLFVIFKLPHYYSIGLISTIFMLMAYEGTKGTGLVKNTFLIILSIISAGIMPCLAHKNAPTEIILLLLFGVIVCAFIYLMLRYDSVSLQELICTIGFGGVLPLFSTLFVDVLESTNGKLLLILIFIVAWAPDSLAYTIGSFFGKHKLFPQISPKKTVEGFIGGIAGGILGSVVYGIILTIKDYQINWTAFIVLGVIGAVLGSLGDLFFSYLKRNFKIKDFGNLLPGHGGVLDRFDSVLFVLPVCNIVFKFWEVIIK